MGDWCLVNEERTCQEFTPLLHELGVGPSHVHGLRDDAFLDVCVFLLLGFPLVRGFLEDWGGEQMPLLLNAQGLGLWDEVCGWVSGAEEIINPRGGRGRLSIHGSMRKRKRTCISSPRFFFLSAAWSFLVTRKWYWCTALLGEVGGWVGEWVGG